MSRLQLLGVAILSVLSTVGVLVAGVGASPDPAATAGLARQVTIAAAPSALAGATTEDEADTAGADSGAAAASAEDEAASAEADAATADTAEAPDVDVEIGEFDDTPEGAADADADANADGDGDGDGDGSTPAAGTAAPRPSKIKHVFLITLAGHGYEAAFGSESSAPYLAGELRAKGTLLPAFRSLGRADLPDRLALVSGQPPNAATEANCATYAEIPPSTKPSADGEITVDGCVYPNTITTIADQVTSSGALWRAYSDDLEKGPKGATPCRRPPSNGADDTQKARPGDGYAARNNPFIYFHSLLDLGDCDANDGPLTKLEADLQSADKTPTLSYIAPNLCNDGTENPCVDGAPGGLAAADAFLKAWVPKILASPAYRADGLLVITFAGAAGAPAGAAGPVRNGALLLSRFAKAGATDTADHDPYSLLRSLEDLLGYRPLARARTAPSFAATALAQAREVEPGDD